MKKRNQASTKDGKTTKNPRQQKARAGLVERGAKKLDPRQVEICQRLKAFRLGKRISRTAFAVAIGIGTERLASYETARAPLRYKIFRVIEREFHLNPVWLANGGDYLPEAPPFEGSEIPSSGVPDRALFSEVFDQHLSCTTGEKTTQKKARAGLVKIEVPMPLALKEAVDRGARKLGISRSQFLELAIREQLPLVESAPKSRHQKVTRVVTGPLSWPLAAYEKAVRQNRFVQTDLTPFQARKLRECGGFTFGDFLVVATRRQLEALRGTVALYWMEFCYGPARPPQLTSLQGSAPKGSRIPAGNRSRKLLARELQKRGMAKKPLRDYTEAGLRRLARVVTKIGRR